MKERRKIGIVAGLVVAGIIGVMPVQGEGEQANTPAAVRVAMLDTAKQLVAEREQQYRAGVGDIDALLGAQGKLCEVELRLASNPGERRKILTATAQAAKETEKLAKARVEQGLAANAELLEARLARLAAELELFEDGG